MNEASSSPCLHVYDTLPPRRQQAAPWFRLDDDQACWDLAELLLRAQERAAQAGLDLIGEQLDQASGGGPNDQLLSWLGAI